MALGATGLAADAFSVANDVPTMLFVILSGGVLDAVLVPQIVRAFKQRNSNDHLNKLLTLTGSVMLGVSFILVLLTAPIVHLLAGSQWSHEQLSLAVAFGVFCMPQVFFYGLYSLLGQVLIAKEKFAAYMWAPIVNNVISCIGLGSFILMYGRAREVVGGVLPAGSVNDLSTWSSGKILLVAGTATLGIVAQSVILMFVIHKSGLNFKLKFGVHNIGLRKTSNIAIWSFAYVLVGQLVSILAFKVASSAPAQAERITGVAGNAAYTQTLAIYILPHALITVSIATALYAKLAKAAVNKDLVAVKNNLSYGMRMTAVFTVFMAFVFVAIPVPIVKIVIPSVLPDDCMAMAVVLSAIAFKLVPMAALMLIQRTFFAFEDAKSVFLFSLPDVLVQTSVILLVMRFLPADYWVAGIAFSGVLSYTVATLVNFYALGKHMVYKDGKRIFRLFVRVGLAGGISFVVGKFITYPLHITSDISWGHAVFVACVVCGAMVAVYYLLLRLFRVTEVNDLLRPVLSKLKLTRS
jgi:putative peptidoglycan lipid II flippase